ncbi:MAG TPA: exodeoxyribonuclease III [Gammaproteobacteria bacterium]|nr:exodeoxyribonuclease III [Gammaproteobacteria bacterium]
MRIITLNINGIRSGAKKGFFSWLATQNADIICLQETKAQFDQINSPEFLPAGYHAYFSDAQKKGYSGVAVYCKQKPLAIHTDIGYPLFAEEGRYLQVDFQHFSVVSLYLPSGSSGEERQAIKFQVLDFYLDYLKKISMGSREFIICGDLNIAHKNIDLKNWRGNQKNSGFLPQERAFLDHVFDELRFIDAFRVLNQEAEQYTWWSNRGQAWAKNVGWRIDYHVTTPNLKDKIKHASIYKDQRFSDHAPLMIDYALSH